MNKSTKTFVRRLAGLAVIVSVCVGAGVPVAASAHASGVITPQTCSKSINWEGSCT